MPLTGTVFGSTLQSLRAARGDTGSMLVPFTNSLGIGVATSLVGKTFTTTDAGSTAGAGTGVGVGLTVSASVVSNALYAASVAKFGSQGPSLQGACDDIAAAFVAEMAQCTLASTHTPVFAGVGTVNVGSISATPSSISAVLIPTGIGLGMGGPSWPDFSDAVAQAASAGLALATGSVTITGAGGTPSPGAGSGTGALS